MRICQAKKTKKHLRCGYSALALRGIAGWAGIIDFYIMNF